MLKVYQTVTIEASELESALKKAFNLGQTYFQQADSDYFSQNRKADITYQKFKDLITITLQTENSHASK
jgi:hypothetical protein